MDDPWAEFRATSNTPVPTPAADPWAEFRTSNAGSAAPVTSSTSILGSLGRGMVSGAAMGWEDELGIADKQKQAASKRDNPWTHFAGEVVGGISTALVPGMAAARIANVGGRVAGAARAALTPFVSAPTATVGQAARQGVKLGATYGAVSGAGNADVQDGDTWGDAAATRLSGAAHGGALGGVVGGALGPVAYKLGEMGNIAATARREMSTPDTASIAAVDRALARDAIDPSALRGQIEVPQYGRLSSEQITTAAERIAAGETIAAVATSLGISAKSVSDAVGRFTSRNAAPLSLVDRAKTQGVASGENTSWTLRAGMSTPGRGRAEAAETLTERQMGQADRIADAADRIVARGDPEARMAAMKQAERAAYDGAKQVEQPFDIGAILTNTEARFLGRSADIPARMNEATRLFREQTSQNPLGLPGPPALTSTGRPGPLTRLQDSPPIQGLEKFQQAKIDLDQMIEDSLNMGRPTPKTRELMGLKSQLMAEVSRANPKWREANDLFADNAAARRLFGDAQAQTFRMSPDMVKELKAVESARLTAAMKKATPQDKAAARARLDMYRDGLAEAITTSVMNKGTTHDATAKFLTPAGRRIIRTVLGAKDADAMLRMLVQEQAINRTYRGLGGSQTTPLREAIDELNGPAMMASAAEYANPRKLFELIVSKVASSRAEARNERMVPMLVDADPFNQLRTLRDIEIMRRARQTGGTYGVTGVAPLSNATINALRGDPRRPSLPQR